MILCTKQSCRRVQSCSKRAYWWIQSARTEFLLGKYWSRLWARKIQRYRLLGMTTPSERNHEAKKWRWFSVHMRLKEIPARKNVLVKVSRWGFCSVSGCREGSRSVLQRRPTNTHTWSSSPKRSQRWSWVSLTSEGMLLLAFGTFGGYVLLSCNECEAAVW